MAIAFVLIVAVVAVLVLMTAIKRHKLSPLSGIELRKQNILIGLLDNWRKTRELGSTEDVEVWLKRKFATLDTDWLRDNRKGLGDEQFISHTVAYILKQPHFVDWLIKKEREETAD